MTGFRCCREVSSRLAVQLGAASAMLILQRACTSQRQNDQVSVRVRHAWGLILLGCLAGIDPGAGRGPSAFASLKKQRKRTEGLEEWSKEQKKRGRREKEAQPATQQDGETCSSRLAGRGEAVKR